MLSANNYITALRGKNGGIRLKHKPEDINIGRVVRLIEQDSTLVECFGENNLCVISPACQLKRILSEAMESFFVSLDEYSLADLLPPTKKSELQSILQMSEN